MSKIRTLIASSVLATCLLESQDTNEEIKTADELIAEIEKEFNKVFPKGFFRGRFISNLSNSVHITIGLVEKQSDLTSNIRNNDPMHTSFTIKGMGEDKVLGDKLEVKLLLGGTLKVNPEEGSHMAMGTVKIPFRKFKGNPSKVVSSFAKYFKKAKDVVKANKDDIYHAKDYTKYLKGI